MGAPVREVLYFVRESSATGTSFGTPETSPVLGTGAAYMRLDQDNSFEYNSVMAQLPIQFGGGLPIEGDTAQGNVDTRGSFNFILFPGIWSKLLLGWAMTPINSGRTAPWTTNDAAGVCPVNDLACMSFYHGHLQEDGTTFRKSSLLGAKCLTWQLSASESDQGRIWRLSGTFIAKRQCGNPWDASVDPTTEFTCPPTLDTSYPTGPYTYSHMGSGTGTWLVGASGGTNRASEARSVSIRCTNKVTPEYAGAVFPYMLRFTRREITASFDSRFRASPDDRASWRNNTPITCKLKLDTGSATITIDLGNNNLYRPWSPILTMGREYGQRATIVNRWDTTAGADLALTITP